MWVHLREYLLFVSLFFLFNKFDILGRGNISWANKDEKEKKKKTGQSAQFTKAMVNERGQG